MLSPPGPQAPQDLGQIECACTEGKGLHQRIQLLGSHLFDIVVDLRALVRGAREIRLKSFAGPFVGP